METRHDPGTAVGPREMDIAGSKNTAALNNTDQHHDDRHDEENVDESAHGGTGHETKDPQDDEYNDDCC